MMLKGPRCGFHDCQGKQEPGSIKGLCWPHTTEYWHVWRLVRLLGSSEIGAFLSWADAHRDAWSDPPPAQRPAKG